MRPITSWITAPLMFWSITTLAASPAPKSTLSVESGYSYPTAAPGITAAGFLTIRGGSEADQLLAIDSSLAESVEVHEVRMTDGVMRMRALSQLTIPARATVTLAPGQYHLMLFSARKAFAVGDQVPLRLRFAKAGTVTTTLKVRARPE